ncbi:MAG: OmpA family protein [Flavobacteriales bacterium]|nr:OmpA family protein [Flavobacteriales bacterium]
MHSTGHPAISADGQRLYFTSDKPGGIGGKDLYVCLRTPHNTWGAPNNLGADINTEGDEMFPFIHENVLFFASDGHLGLGGLDLFRVTVRAKGFGVVENLNAPINSSCDDFGLCLVKDGNVGYMTSDREGSTLGEEIYSFRVNSVPQEERKWIGRVLDENDALPLAHLPVKLYDLDRNEIARSVTSQNGTYEFAAPKVVAEIYAEIPGGARAILKNDEISISTFGDTELPDLYIDGVMDLPVNAILSDGRTNEPLAGVHITVKDTRDGAILFVGETDERGISQGQIPDRRYGDDMNLEVTFTKDGYFKKVSFVDFRILMFLEQTLTGPEGQTLSAVAAGVDIAKAMNLRPIYFDFREAKIRTDAMGELDLVAEVMRVDPAMKIDLRSHTDSRASDEYNQSLSQRRADSTREYLIQQGIDGSRITAHGYGERELVNRCADGMTCSEEEHQLNRRTEFIVTNCANNALGSFKE